MKSQAACFHIMCLSGAAWKPGSPNTLHLSDSRFLGGKYFFWVTGQHYGSEVKFLDLHNVGRDGSAVPVSPGAARPVVYRYEWDKRGWVTLLLVLRLIKAGLRLTLVFALDCTASFVSAARSKSGTTPDLQILLVSFMQVRLTTSFEHQQIPPPQLWPRQRVSQRSVLFVHTLI